MGVRLVRAKTAKGFYQNWYSSVYINPEYSANLATFTANMGTIQIGLKIHGH
jgi:hypothetical protein